MNILCQWSLHSSISTRTLIICSTNENRPKITLSMKKHTQNHSQSSNKNKDLYFKIHTYTLKKVYTVDFKYAFSSPLMINIFRQMRFKLHSLSHTVKNWQICLLQVSEKRLPQERKRRDTDLFLLGSSDLNHSLASMLCQGRFRLDVKTFFQNTGTGFLGRQEMSLHLDNTLNDML